MRAAIARLRGSAGSALALALALGGAAAPAAALVRSAPSAADREVVARVDGEAVTRAELDRMAASPRTLDQARQELGVERPGPADLRRVALRNVVERRLLIREARRRGIRVTEPELDREIASLRRRFDDLRSFGAWMNEQGLDEATLWETVREDMAADQVRTALIEGVRVTDEDVRRYHAAHAPELGPGEVRLQVIAVGGEREAKEVLTALRDGEDFGRVARARSSGIRARDGGDTGWVRADALASPLRESVAILKPGESRGPLRRGSDFLFVRLNERRRGPARTLEEVRSEIERRLLPEKQRSAVEAWLVEQESGTKIELFGVASGAGSRPKATASASSGR
jgi:parvulin-like peptidyl-prolyl isomerase